nr:hypothetical protein [Tanacetum cinerariifolium]
MSVKYPTYVNITSSSEKQPNERTPSPPPRKKSLSPPQAPSKSIYSKSTYYTSSSSPKLEMEPEEDGGDNEKSEGDSIEYSTSRGDDDADDDGDDLSEDDADDKDEEESSDSEEEEEEHLSPTVPTSALHSSITASEDSDETKPFEEGETAATPPRFGYHVAARISVQPHILMPFRSESEVERLLAIPTPPLSPVSLTSYSLPPFLMPLPIFTPLPPPPTILPRTRASMTLMRFAAPSTFILALRSRTPPIGTPPLLPIPLPTSSFPLPLSLPSTSSSESIPEANIPLWKRARFTTSTGGYEIGESSVAAAARQIMPTLTIAESRRAEDRLIGRLRRERRYFCTLSITYAQGLLTLKMGPKRARTTRANPDPTRTTTAAEPMIQEAINNLIAQRLAEALAEYETQRNSVVNGDTSNTTGIRPKTVHPTRECTYKDYLKCGPLKFNGTEGVIGLTRWGEIKKLEVKLWNLKVKGMYITSYTLCFQELTLLCGRVFPEESDEIERYVGGLPEMIRGNVMSYEPKSMQKAIEFANDQMDQKLLGIADHQVDNKRKFDNTSRSQQNQQPFRRNNNVAHAYAAGPCRPKCTNCKRTGHIARDYRSRAANTNNNNNNNWRAIAAYQGVPTCFECGAQGHFKNNCLRLGNRNQGNQNQAGNGNAVARAYGLESDKIERYVGRLPEMIRGNVMSYETKSMQKAIESANEQMDQKLTGIADRQAAKRLLNV